MATRRNEDVLRQFGERVAEARRDRGWSQEQLAEAIEVEPATISRWETGGRALSLSTLTRISEILEVPLARLFDIEQDIPQPKHDAEATALLRSFKKITSERRKLLLALARELST